MTQSFSRVLLASLFAAAALSACSSNSNPTACTTTADCATGDTCVSSQCLAPGQCAAGILSCSEAANCGSGDVCTNGCCTTTEGCATSTDCTNPARPHCDTTTHACVPCTGNTECPAEKVCTAAGACEASCTSDTNCSGTTPHCVTSGGYCGQCTESSQCPSAQPICDNNVCTGCTTNANCAAPTPVCNTSTKGCVTCIDSQNGSNGKNSACPSATPSCESGACVACNPASNNATTGANGACSGATPSCGPASTCVACTLSSECATGGTCGSSNTCETVSLVSFTSSATTLVTGGTATLTATLNGSVSTATTINVDIATDGGVSGTLSAATVVIASGNTGTVTFTAPQMDGTAVVEATLGSTTLSVPINVTSTAASLASIALVSSTAAAPGSAVQATVSLSAAPASDTVVAVSVNNGATINSGATANITVPSGQDTSAPFTIQLACNTATTTATATLSSVTQTVTVPLDTSAPAVASLIAGTTSMVASGAGTTLAITLTQAAGCAGTPVTLSSSNIGFKTESKVNSYFPGTITVPAGQTTATVNIVPECTTNTTGDVIYFSAQVPGSAAVGITTPISMGAIASGTIGLCPISPAGGERPLTYLLGDGGTAPLPTLLTVGYFEFDAGTTATGAYSVALSAIGADGGACGSFTQDGGALLNGTLTLTSAGKTEITFLPGSSPGPCTLAAQGFNPSASITYDAGVVSTFNLVNYDWTQQQMPNDLTLTKVEIDEDTNRVASLTDGGPVYGDATEYVEVYNPTSSAIDFSTVPYSLVFVGAPDDNSGLAVSDGGPGSMKRELWSFALTGTLQPGHYLIAQDANTFDAGPTSNTDLLLTWPDAGFAANVAAGLSATSTSASSGALRDGNIANAPGGIFLVKNPGTASATIVDGVNYGGPMQIATSQSITGTVGGVFSWPPAPQIPLDNWIIDNSFVKGSLVRIGYTGSPSLDWTDSTTVTPGAPNNMITGP